MGNWPQLGGMHASAVVKVVRDKLVSALRDAAATMPENLRRHLEELKGKMETMAEVMGDAEMRSIREEEVRELLICLGDAAYGIWDMVDELQCNKGQPVLAVRRPCCLPIAIARKGSMATTMSNAIENLDLLQQRLQRFAFRTDDDNTGKIEQSVHDAHPPARTAASVDEEDFCIVGREEVKQRMMAAILSAASDSDRGLFFLAIVGMGSIGKTTLAKMVFCHTTVIRDYARAWVNVGYEFDLKKIGNCILSQLSNKGEHQDSSDVELIVKRLDKLLGGGNRVLVVLDDIRPWTDLEGLKRMLGAGKKDTQVILMVTTSYLSIAQTLGGHIYEVPLLSNEESWQLLQRKLAFTTRSDNNARQLAQVLGRCNGDPSVIHALGYALLSKNPEEIISMINNNIKGEEYGSSSMFSLLPVSYQCMPPNLRLCFAYCAIFPMGHSIPKDDLVHHWTALQLIEPSDKLSTTQLANKYIRMLLGMSFLQPSMPPSDDRSAVSFTLYDLIHDLALAALSKKLFISNSRYNCQENSYQYAWLTNFDATALNLSCILSTQLRVLLFHGCSNNKQLIDVFSLAKYLRVLDLRDCCLQKLPDSICQLRQLRYLNLSGSSSLVNLPDSFGSLLNLGHIDLSGCSGLLELPASFGNLTNVVHIDLSGCVGLKTLPPESFGLLKRLEHLDLSSCSCLEGILDFVDGLTNLQHLNLSHPCCYLAKHRFHLKALKDIWVELIDLRYLNLSMCLNAIFCYLTEKERIKYIESISCLHKLEHLDLSHNIFLSDIPESLCQLGELQILNLSGCVRLKRIDKWMGERNCPKKLLVISNCLGLERYQFVIRTDGGGKSNLAQLKDVSCKEVEISCLEKVTFTEEAQSIGLTEKKKLQKLTLVWSAGRDDVSSKDQALLAELVPPQNMQCFELHGYSSAYLPVWLTSSILSHLPNLMEVTMVDIPSCGNLPQVGVLPNLRSLILRRVATVTRIDASYLSGDSKDAFRRLLHVTLDDMLNLKEIDTYSCRNRFEFPTLDELVINKCPKLRFGDPPPKARMLVISDCDQLMMSPAERRGEHHVVEDPSSSTCTTSAHVTEVVIESCKVPLDELKWSLLEGMAHLHSLHIRNCSEEIISPEIMKGRLSSLQLLYFSHCVDMTYLPEHVVQDTSLKQLVIDDCRGIKSLPQSVCEKKNKHYPLLHIRDCPELKKWCELEENKTKLAHIQLIFEESDTHGGLHG